MNITKSAPLPERPCEQLTCCALCVCDPKHKHGNDSRYQAGGQCNYPLGSMPRCCNSLRIIRFIQAARESSPSCCCAFSIFSRKSGSKRNWNGGLPRLSFLCVDTLITPHVMYLCVVTHYTQSTQKAKPAGAMNTNGLLTKPLIEVTIMAIKEHSLLFIHTQTPRKRNNPFHSSVLCTHPGGRFLPDLSRRGYLSTKSSRANFSGGTKRGAGGGIFVLVSSSSSLAQASDCLCRMISSSCVCVSCIGDSVLLVMILPCKAMRRSTSRHGADSDYSDSWVLRRWSSSRATVTSCPISSAALMPICSILARASSEDTRGFSPLPSAWRRAISPRMAVTINPALLSPSSLTDSIPCITSSGTLTVVSCDFAFLLAVAISETPNHRCVSVYTKKEIQKALTCVSCAHNMKHTKGIVEIQRAKPRKCRYHSQGF
ncbi:TPA: host cell division inhibitor Icd-like protein [Escherichia coli O146:H21]|nr:host cell division inhibitor Icd-like protein [Escherichia coli O146:H21]